jgi:flagellar hook-length control protein FliK
LTTQQAIAAQQITSDQVTAQMAVDAQASSQENTLTEAALLQGIATQQTAVETKTTQVTQQQLAIKQNMVALTQNPVLTAPTQQGTLNQAVVAQSVQTTIENTALVASQQTAQSIANNAIQNPQIETSPKAVKTPVSIATDVVNSSDLTGENLNGSLEITIETPLLVDAQLSDSSAVVSDQNAQQVVVDATLLPDTLVTMQVTPQVVAQDVPVDQTESDIVFDKGSDTSNTGDRITTLTSAKTLLMDAVANRNNSGDAGNGNHSSNTPQNSSLSNDTSLNQSIDNKQNIDAKSFATLLTAEKADVISVSSADKATPQAVNAVVNKLAQDVKSADVAPLTRPLSHPQWNEDLGERIVWMNSRGISSAEIKMNPEHMGPITVRIDMNQDQATIAFTAQNSAVRDALEASLPKLRDMLSAQQVNLADVSVSQQSTSNSDSGRSAFAQATADMSNGQGNRQNTPEVDSEGNLIASNANNETVDEFENGQVISTNGTNGLLSIYA